MVMVVMRAGLVVQVSAVILMVMMRVCMGVGRVILILITVGPRVIYVIAMTAVSGMVRLVRPRAVCGSRADQVMLAS